MIGRRRAACTGGHRQLRHRRLEKGARVRQRSCSAQKASSSRQARSRPWLVGLERQ